MAIIVNPNIIGTTGDETLTNSNRGYTYMSGVGGDDTYVVEKINNSFTEIQHTDSTTPGSATNNILQIQNLKGNDLTLFFDVDVNPTGTPEDTLFVARKNLLSSVVNQVEKFNEALVEVQGENPTISDEEQLKQLALKEAAPQRGAVEIPDFFGTTNNQTTGGDFGANYIQTIQTIDKNGITRTLNLDDYVTAVTTQVREFLTEYGYTSVKNLMLSNDTRLQNQLLNIYKNQLINLTIEGTANTNDKLTGENGNDTFVFANDSGNDSITSSRGDDILNFTDSTFADLTFTRDRNNLIISHNENKDTVTLTNYLTSPDRSSIKNIITSTPDTTYSIIDDAVVEITAEAGKRNNITGTKINDSITGAALNDTLRGGNGDDSIIGALGNDKLYGDAGENTIYFTEGDGIDTVYSGRGEDTLYFNGINQEGITYSASTSGGLILNYADNSSVEISNYFRKKGDVSIKNIYTAGDSENQTLASIVSAEDFVIELDGTVGKKNRINGTYLNDVINGKELADTLKGLDGNDSISGFAGNDNLNGGDGNDTLLGGEGNDTIRGGYGADSIIGGKGNDKLYGESGQNTFIFNEGDGNDTIYLGNGLDSLTIDDTEPISYYRDRNNLVISYGTTTDSVTVSSYFSRKNPSVDMVNDLSLKGDIIIEGYNTVENGVTVKQYTGNDNTNLIYANGRYDLVNAGGGNDVIQIMSSRAATVNGGAGDDYYEVKSLSPLVKINDTAGTDTLTINERKSNTNIIFEVLKTGSAPTEENDSLYIVNDSNLRRIQRDNDLDDITGGIEIESLDQIEQINVKDGYVTTTQIDEVKTNVVSWLANTSYDSAMQALEEGNDATVKELLAIYQNIQWQSPVTV